MKKIFYSLFTITILLNGLCLNAQTTCPNLVTNADFEAGVTGFTSALAVNAGCVINTYNVTTNFTLKCPNFPSRTDHTTGTGKFLVVQNSTAVNVWQNTVTVTPNTPYTFSFWVANGVTNAMNYAMMVNTVNVNQITVTQSTPTWAKYSFSGFCPAGVTSLSIAIKQITFGEAYVYGIDDVSFVSCSDPPCIACTGSVATANLISNGSFTNGDIGFTTGLTYDNNIGGGVGCGGGRYGVYTNFTSFCTGWPSLLDHTNNSPASSRKYLTIDGFDFLAILPVWQSPVNLTPNTDYCFSFWCASVYPTSQQSFPISVDIVTANGFTVVANLGTQTIAQSPQGVWVQKTITWNSGSLTGLQYVAIRQPTPNGFSDWGIDDICFTAKPPPCNAEFTFQNIDNCGNVQFTNTSTTPDLARPGYSWNFGDPNSGANNTSVLQSPSHQFSGCGTFNVCMILDGTGCKDTICHTVTISDITPPVARCKPGVGVILDANCQYNVTSAFVDNGSTDNCQIKSLVVNPAIVFGCANTTVTLTVTDWCNNRSTCTMGIQTIETVPPTIVCPPTATVTCTTDTIPSVTGTATATDNCPGPITFTRSDVVSGNMPCDATIRRTWTATDACGNKSTCTQIIAVRDNVPPIITCPQNISVQCGATTPSVTGTATATDNCSTPTVTFADIVTGTLPCNTTIRRTWTARDGCGNTATCVQTITVNDNTPPTIVCPQSYSVNTNQGVCYYTGVLTQPTVTDNCDQNLDIVCSLLTATSSILISPTTQFPKGVNNISCIAADDCGNASTVCNFTLTVVDNQKPTITCPLSISVVGSITPPSTVCKAIVNGIVPTVTDNCPMVTTIYSIASVSNGTTGTGNNDASGTTFMGTSSVTYTATDMAGNTASCSFTISVKCVPCLAAFTYAASGNCNNIQFTNQSSGTPPLTYIWTFGDPNSGSTNNTSTAQNPIHPFSGCGTFNVCLYLTTSDGCRDTLCRSITIDNTPPNMTCPANTTVMCTKDTVPTITGRPTVADNCPGTVTVSYTDVITGTLPCNGTIRRTWTARDVCGNTVTCVQTITVNDITPPIITNCPTNQTVNTNAGQCYYTFPTLPAITATDNCDPTPSVSYTYINSLGITLPFTTATQFPKGVTFIKITARDACNNVSRECAFTITVVDNQKPTITCPLSITVVGTYTLPPVQCKAIVNGLAPTVTDNCPMVNTTFTIASVSNGTTGSGNNDASGTSFMGTSSVTYTATDMGGNTASCSFTVTVRCDSSGTSIFKCGMAVITCFSGFNPGTSTANGSGPVLATIDERNHVTAPLGVNWAAVSSTSTPIGGIYHAPTWDATHMGQLFGVTIDGNYNVYASSTTMYGKYLPSTMTNADFGNVYKIDAVTGVPTRIAQLSQDAANPAGLGDVWFDDNNNNNQLFVSNFYDGNIHRMTTSGVPIGTPYHFPGVPGYPFFASVTNPGFAPLGQRVWAVARNGNRLYFSVWCEDRGYIDPSTNTAVVRNSTAVKNWIYSVQLNATGAPITGTEQVEIQMPPFTSSTSTAWSSPVSDISFSSSGRMLVAERSMNNDFGNAYIYLGQQAHSSRILEFWGTGWSNMKTIYIGNVGAGVHANSAGGIDYGYESFNTNVPNPKPVLCDSMVWGTGDALRYRHQGTTIYNIIPDPSTLPCGGGLNDYVYGLAGMRSIGNSNIVGSSNYVKDYSIYIDVDNNLCTNEKTQLGDVDIFKNCINCQPKPTYPCDSLMVMSRPITRTGRCCYAIDIKNLSTTQNFTKICANLNTAGWIFNTGALLATGWVWDATSPNQLCFKPTTGSIPVGQLQDVLTFCLSETSPTAPSVQVITFDWYVGNEVVCKDTIRTNCVVPVVKDTCLVINNLVANCFGENDLEYCVTFTVTNLNNTPAFGLVLSNLPAGYSYGSCGCGGQAYGTGGWLFSGFPVIPANATRTFCVKIIATSPILSPTNICFNAGLEFANQCCSATKDWCVQLKPCCNPCQNTSIKVDALEGNCCYSVDFKYNCDFGYYTHIDFDILTPGVYYSWHTTSLNFASPPTQNHASIVPPLGGTIAPGTYNDLFNFCLTDINLPSEVPQVFRVRYWTIGSNGQDSIACDTTLRFNCPFKKDTCLFVTNERIRCIKDSMKYQITVTVQNLAVPNFTATHLSLLGDPVISPNPIAFSTPLTYGNTGTVTFCYTPTTWPDADGILPLIYRLKNGTPDTCCNGGQSYIDTLILPSCDTCKCKPNSFTGLNYRPTQGGQQRFITCGDTLIANCASPTFNWTLGGNFQCAGDSCPATSQMSWILRGPPGSGVATQTGPMSGPNFNISLPTSYFSKAGNYVLELRGICGRDTCRCIFLIKADGCPCCQDINTFNQNIANFISVSVNNTLCKATLNIGNLPNCDMIQYINWGQGAQQSGPFMAGDMPMFTYSGSGTYVISYLVVEKNPATGAICFEKLVKDTVRLTCNSDSCRCGTFTQMTFRPAQGAQTVSIKCGDTLTLGCNPTFNPIFTGTFQCVGNCTTTGIKWALRKLPNGPLVASGNGTYPSFSLALLGSYFASAGQYELTFTGLCGNTDCPPCRFIINVLPAVNLSAGLTGYFPFNGNANDISPTLINGIPSNVISAAGANGAPNSAYSFNGTTSWIDGNINNRGVTDKVSVCAWVRTTETLRGMWVAGQYNGPTQAKGYLLAIGDLSNSVGTIGLASFSGRVDISAYNAANSPATMKVNDGRWHCLVGTAGIGTTGVSEWKIYVDGVLANSVLGATSTIAPSNTSFTIGRHSDLSLGTMWYSGNMDDVRVYSKVLTQCEIDSLCSIRFVSGVGDINDRIRVSIFPNPNRGSFTLELSKRATAKMSYRVTNLMGQLIFEKPIETGSEQQSVEVKDLTEGLYFLHIVSEGKVVAIEKFVKQ